MLAPDTQVNPGNRFTPEQAAENQVKAVIARNRNREAREAERLAALKAAMGHTVSQYQGKRLERVRAQLDLLDQRIEEQVSRKVPDGQTLNWLASAQARLSEQERQLCGRPMPGSLKPTTARRSKSSHEVIEIESPTPPEPPAQTEPVPPAPFTEP